MTIRTLSVIFILSSCSPKSNDRTAQLSDSALTEYGTMIVQADSVIVEEQCIRGQATAIVKSSVYPGASFRVNADSLTGTETVTLPNGDHLTIRNWGCEYYVLTFRFETTRFDGDTTNMLYWLDKATVLMDGVGNGLDAPLNLEQGTAVTKELVRAGGQYNLGDEIEYDSSQIRGFVTLDRVQKLSYKQFAVEISYALGPL